MLYTKLPHILVGWDWVESCASIKLTNSTGITITMTTLLWFTRSCTILSPVGQLPISFSLWLQVSPSGSLPARLSSGGMQSASPIHLNLGSGASHGSITGSPDSVNLQSLMNAPLSADKHPLSLDQLRYCPNSDRLGGGTRKSNH